jgi:hypothetical protein
MSDRGGLVVRTSAGLRFVPAEHIRAVITLGTISPVPGLPRPALGVTMAEGRVLTVLRIDEAGARETVGIICDLEGDAVVLAAEEVLSAGVFPSESSGVRHGGEVAVELPVRALYADIEAALWSARALRLSREPLSQREPREAT